MTTNSIPQILYRAVLAAAVVFGVGCGDVKSMVDAAGDDDVDAPVGDVDGAVDAADPVDANPACTGTSTCVTLPAGWTGPVTYATASGQVAACSGAYPTEAFVAHQDLDAGTATCGCTCGAISLTCGAVTATGYSGTSCTTAVGNISMPLNTCISVSESAGTFPTTNSFNFDLGTATKSCGAPTTSRDIPTPSWATDSRVCGGAVEATPGICGADAFCAPPAIAPFGPVCVFRAGDNACPADFPTRELVHQGFADSRTCTTCSCSPANATCTAVVRRYQNGANNCTGTSTADVAVSETGSGCINRSQDGLRTVSVTPNASASCQRSGGTLTGSATPDQAMTICCR